MYDLVPCQFFMGGWNPNLKWVEKYAGLIQYAMENYPHWSHGLLTVAIALERYVLICHPADSQSILSRTNRILF